MMSAGNNKEYSFEIKDVTLQETAKIAEVYGAQKFYRVGPKGYFVNEGIKDAAICAMNMEIRPTDTFVVAHPRSGTTWTQEMVWMIANDLDYEKSKTLYMTERFRVIESIAFMSPLVKNGLFERNHANQHYLDIVRKISQSPQERLGQMPSPRFMKTHIPISLLPPSILDIAKVVYVARDPRDVAVSQYHLSKLFCGESLFDFTTYWNAFINDKVFYAPYFEHLNEAWEKRHHPNLLFLFYEDLSKDISGTVQRVADFLGKKIEEPALSRLCEHLSFENFKKSNSVIPIVYEEIGLINESKNFIRRGKAGGWRDYFDSQMSQQAEQWIANNLRHTDLRFPDVENNLIPNIS